METKFKSSASTRKLSRHFKFRKLFLKILKRIILKRTFLLLLSFELEEFDSMSLRMDYTLFKLRVGASRSSHVGRSVGPSVGPWKILTIFDIKVS